MGQCVRQAVREQWKDVVTPSRAGVRGQESHGDRDKTGAQEKASHNLGSHGMRCGGVPPDRGASTPPGVPTSLTLDPGLPSTSEHCCPTELM